MSFNFPNSPTDGTTFAPVGGPTYVFSSGVWKLAGGGSSFVVSSDTAPASPFPGMLWFETDTGALYFWYVDADSSQWVQINFTPSGVRTADTRNRIVNPAMQISQENASTETGSPNAYYPADQWFVGASGSTNAKMLAQRNPNTPTMYGSVNRLRLRTNAVVVPAVGEYVNWQQPIEGSRIADFQWGTANAKPALLRFGFRGPAAIYSISIRNSDATLAYAQLFTISAAQADIDTEQLITIPAPTSGTFATDNTRGITVYITLCAGATYTTAPGVWTAGNFVGANGMTNSLPNAAMFFLSDVGLYFDPRSSGVAPPWQMPDEAQELIACQRYFHKFTAAGAGTPFAPGYMLNTTLGRSLLPLSPAMRSGLSTSFSAVGDFAFCTTGAMTASAVTVSNMNTEMLVIDATIAAQTQGVGGYLRSVNANAVISVSARM